MDLYTYESFDKILDDVKFEPSMPNILDFRRNSKNYFNVYCPIELFDRAINEESFQWFTLCRSRRRNSEKELVLGLVKIVPHADDTNFWEIAKKEKMLNAPIQDKRHLINAIRYIARRDGNPDNYGETSIHFQRKIFNKYWKHDGYYERDMNEMITHEINNLLYEI